VAREQFRFFSPIRVRWAEADMQGVVFNGHYLTYFDVAFTEYWRTLGLPGAVEQAREGRELFARKSSIEYHAPAHFDEILSVGVRCARLGNSSMRIEIEIYRDDPTPGEFLISGEIVYVYAEPSARRAVPLPDAWRSTLAEFESTPIGH
jgi:acyl-CoA thioester hydrolase